MPRGQAARRGFPHARRPSAVSRRPRARFLGLTGPQNVPNRTDPSGRPRVFTSKEAALAKQDRGTKREDPETGRKFYDLNRDPIISPYTGKSYPRSYFEQNVARRAGSDRDEEEDEDEVDVEDVVVAPGEPEVISLEDADAEEASETAGEEIPDVEDVEDVEDIGDDDEDAFLEEDEEEDD